MGETPETLAKAKAKAEAAASHVSLPNVTTATTRGSSSISYLNPKSAPTEAIISQKPSFNPDNPIQLDAVIAKIEPTSSMRESFQQLLRSYLETGSITPYFTAVDRHVQAIELKAEKAGKKASWDIIGKVKGDEMTLIKQIDSALDEIEAADPRAFRTFVVGLDQLINEEYAKESIDRFDDDVRKINYDYIEHIEKLFDAFGVGEKSDNLWVGYGPLLLEAKNKAGGIDRQTIYKIIAKDTDSPEQAKDRYNIVMTHAAAIGVQGLLGKVEEAVKEKLSERFEETLRERLGHKGDLSKQHLQVINAMVEKYSGGTSTQIEKVLEYASKAAVAHSTSTHYDGKELAASTQSTGSAVALNAPVTPSTPEKLTAKTTAIAD